GSQASSPTSRTSFSPLMPPAALMSATACSAPALICSPNEAYWPVIGPAVAITMSASAAPERLMPTTAATLDRRNVFMELLPLLPSMLDPFGPSWTTLVANTPGPPRRPRRRLIREPIPIFEEVEALGVLRQRDHPRPKGLT